MKKIMLIVFAFAMFIFQGCQNSDKLKSFFSSSYENVETSTIIDDEQKSGLCKNNISGLINQINTANKIRLDKLNGKIVAGDVNTTGIVESNADYTEANCTANIKILIPTYVMPKNFKLLTTNNYDFGIEQNDKFYTLSYDYYYKTLVAANGKVYYNNGFNIFEYFAGMIKYVIDEKENAEFNIKINQTNLNDSSNINNQISDEDLKYFFKFMHGGPDYNPEVIIKNNSKGVKIVCMQDMTLCNTEQEIIEYKNTQNTGEAVGGGD